jgi:5-bromo-4-chloroindolyl phosphate hydrolysis protein
MLDKGYFPVGHLDLGRGILVLGAEGMQFGGFSDFVRESEENLNNAATEEQGELAEYQKLVDQLRHRNDRIQHAEMSHKIEMIERTSRRIFDYVRNYPDKKGQLNHFFRYYLPTTLNLLERYAQMEEQKVEGTNITLAKERIEGMMDKVVEGFEKQLDQLFAGTAMDIGADVAVLERMLQKDGLSTGGYTMGI